MSNPPVEPCSPASPGGYTPAELIKRGLQAATNCVACGKFSKHAYRYVYGPGHLPEFYCSSKCAIPAMKCSQCRKCIPDKNPKIKEHTRKFCSDECYTKYEEEKRERIEESRIKQKATALRRKKEAQEKIRLAMEQAERQKIKEVTCTDEVASMMAEMAARKRDDELPQDPNTVEGGRQRTVDGNECGDLHRREAIEGSHSPQLRVATEGSGENKDRANSEHRTGRSDHEEQLRRSDEGLRRAGENHVDAFIRVIDALRNIEPKDIKKILVGVGDFYDVKVIGRY